MRTDVLLLAALCAFTPPAFAAPPEDGSVLPFSTAPSASVAKPRLQDSIHKRRVALLTGRNHQPNQNQHP